VINIPNKFNKNAPDVRALGSQAETGAWLIQYMCERIGLDDLSNVDLLDLGCGCRFADSFLNQGVPIKSYTGIDVDTELMHFFRENLADNRFVFAHWDAANPMYNPGGVPLTKDASLPIDNRQFDVICMFSVITHQLPEDAAAIFSILRRYIAADGFLFFSATIEEVVGDYAELNKDRPTAHSAYAMHAMTRMLAETGWNIISFEGKDPRGLPIQDSFLCAPGKS
jgi:SAM-dependent methyltransferase